MDPWCDQPMTHRTLHHHPSSTMTWLSPINVISDMISSLFLQVCVHSSSQPSNAPPPSTSSILFLSIRSWIHTLLYEDHMVVFFLHFHQCWWVYLPLGKMCWFQAHEFGHPFCNIWKLIKLGVVVQPRNDILLQWNGQTCFLPQRCMQASSGCKKFLAYICSLLFLA
jgi:hypothetical protein